MTIKNNKIFFCKIQDLKKKKFITKYIDDLKDEIIIFIDKKTQKFKSFSSICPHFGGEIHYNYITDDLVCNWHGWRFCKDSGKCLSHPIKGNLRQYDFIVEPNKLKEYNIQTVFNEIFIVYPDE